jgi:hypothetical protein
MAAIGKKVSQDREGLLASIFCLGQDAEPLFGNQAYRSRRRFAEKVRHPFFRAKPTSSPPIRI